jgi:hypothetical protein
VDYKKRIIRPTWQIGSVLSPRVAPINSAAMRLNITEMFQRKTRKASSHASGIDGKKRADQGKG